VIVTDVPPAPEPVVGETEVMVGEGVGVVMEPVIAVDGPVPTPFVAVTEIV
jgi:hypothetical protein